MKGLLRFPTFFAVQDAERSVATRAILTRSEPLVLFRAGP